MFDRLRQWAGALALAGLMGATSAQAGYLDVYVFGDSLSDDGASLTATALKEQPPARSTNGPVAVAVLASRIQANLHNYAIGGAKTGLTNSDYAVGALHYTGVQAQVAIYKNELGTANADGAALYVLAGGANDILEALGGPEDINDVTARMVTNLLGSVTELYDLGAKHFLLSLLPDLGATPEAIQAGLGAELTALSVAFNAALLDAYNDLAANVLMDANVIVFDLLAEQQAIIRSPGAFGLTNVDAACSVVNVATCDTSFYWDTLHPTAAASRLLAADLEAAIPEPGTLALMALAVAALPLQRRAQRRRTAA